MFWSRKTEVDKIEREVSQEVPRQVEEQGVKPQKVQRPGDNEEVAEYVALCKKIKAETPAVRMLQLRQFLAERGIPEYDTNKVHEHLRRLAEARGQYFVYTWHPLREEDKGTSFRWHWGRLENKCDSDDSLYHRVVPSSVLETVSTILDEFPDAKFFVSNISAVKDPFLLITFLNVDPVVVDFWDEPDFRQ